MSSTPRKVPASPGKVHRPHPGDADLLAVLFLAVEVVEPVGDPVLEEGSVVVVVVAHDHDPLLEGALLLARLVVLGGDRRREQQYGGGGGKR